MLPLPCGSSWVSQVSGSTECLGGTPMVCLWCTSPCTIPNSLPWTQLSEGLEDKKDHWKSQEIMRRLYLKDSKAGKRRGGFWIIVYIVPWKPTISSNLTWMLKPANCYQNLLPKEVTDWLLSWLARCFQLNPVCRDKGRTQRHTTRGKCGELWRSRCQKSLEWQLGIGEGGSPGIIWTFDLVFVQVLYFRELVLYFPSMCAILEHDPSPTKFSQKSGWCDHMEMREWAWPFVGSVHSRIVDHSTNWDDPCKNHDHRNISPSVGKLRNHFV